MAGAGVSCRLVGVMGPPSLVCCLAWRGRCLSQLSLLHLPDSPRWLWQPHWRKHAAGREPVGRKVDHGYGSTFMNGHGHESQ